MVKEAEQTGIVGITEIAAVAGLVHVLANDAARCRIRKLRTYLATSLGCWRLPWFGFECSW